MAPPPYKGPRHPQIKGPGPPRAPNNNPRARGDHFGKSPKNPARPARVPPLIFIYLGPPVAPPPPPAALPRNSLPGDALKTSFGPLRLPINPKTMFWKVRWFWKPKISVILEIQYLGPHLFGNFTCCFLHLCRKRSVSLRFS